MTIKTTISNKKSTSEVTYPCIGVYATGKIVLFTDISSGTVLRTNDPSSYPVGSTSTNFRRDWMKFEGELILLNE